MIFYFYAKLDLFLFLILFLSFSFGLTMINEPIFRNEQVLLDITTRYYSESARSKRSLDHGCQHVPRFFLTGGNRFFSFCVPSCDNDQWSLEVEQQRHSGDLARASSARLNPEIRNGDTSGELSIVSFFFPPSPLRTRGHCANPAHVSSSPPPPPLRNLKFMASNRISRGNLFLVFTAFFVIENFFHPSYRYSIILI